MKLSRLLWATGLHNIDLDRSNIIPKKCYVYMIGCKNSKTDQVDPFWTGLAIIMVKQHAAYSKLFLNAALDVSGSYAPCLSITV